MTPGERPAGRGPPPATWIPAVYFALSAAWIALSDDLVAMWAASPAQVERWSIIKGWGFVAVTSLAFAWGLRRVQAQQRVTSEHLDQLARRARDLVETSPDAILIQEGLRIAYANPAAQRLLGADPAASLVGRSVLELVDPADRAAAEERSARAEAERPAPPSAVQRMRRLDGSTLRAEVALARFPGPGEPALQVTLRDVTQAWLLQEEVRRIHGALRTLGAVNEALVRAGSERELMEEVCRIAVDHGGYRLAWVGVATPGAAEPLRPVAVHGLGPIDEPEPGLGWSHATRPEGLAATALRTGQPCVVADLAADPRTGGYQEVVRRRGYGSGIALPMNHGGDRLGALTLLAGEAGAFDQPVVQLLQQLVDDLAFGLVALRTRAALASEEARLRESRGQLRALAGRLQSVREEEKARMARDLHDELGQLLTALKMDLRWMERRLSDLPASDAVNLLVDRAVGASELADQTVASVQRIAAELRPGALDRLGLAPALRQEVRRFQERTGLACEARLDEAAPEPPPEVATALYRICQEALTNVSRHAGATRVLVALAAEPTGLVLRIEDDGRGFDAAALGPEALGLLGMTERAILLGGAVAFSRGPEGGTVVTARVPLGPPAAEGP